MVYRSLWLRFDLWFIALTVMYWLLSTFGQGVSTPTIVASDVPQQMNPAAAFIGLFVPVGPNNLPLLLSSPIGWLAVGIALCALFFGESFLSKYADRPAKKISANMVLLFVVTTIVDVVYFFPWPVSIMIFLTSIGT